MKKLVIITGRKRAGKDCMGDYLVKNYGYKKAQPLACFKKALGEWFGFNSRQVEGDLKEVVDQYWKISPRQLFQVFGTELMRSDLNKYFPEYDKVVGDRLWSIVFKRWFERQPDDGKYVLCDMRFIAEYNVLKDIDNITFIRVDNPRCSGTDKHQSENEIDLIPVDYVINNDGTLEDLYDKINTIF